MLKKYVTGLEKFEPQFKELYIKLAKERGKYKDEEIPRIYDDVRLWVVLYQVGYETYLKAVKEAANAMCQLCAYGLRLSGTTGGQKAHYVEGVYIPCKAEAIYTHILERQGDFEEATPNA